MEIRPTGNVAQSGPVVTERPASHLIAAKPVAPPVDVAAAVQQPVSIPSLAQVKQAVQNINKTMQALSQNLEFTIDEDSDRTIVKVIDQETKEVIRQMPSKETLEIAKALDKVQGLLIRQKA